eukprot:1677546-Rhodomonas_salina.2
MSCAPGRRRRSPQSAHPLWGVEWSRTANWVMNSHVKDTRVAECRAWQDHDGGPAGLPSTASIAHTSLSTSRFGCHRTGCRRQQRLPGCRLGRPTQPLPSDSSPAGVLGWIPSSPSRPASWYPGRTWCSRIRLHQKARSSAYGFSAADFLVGAKVQWWPTASPNRPYRYPETPESRPAPERVRPPNTTSVASKAVMPIPRAGCGGAPLVLSVRSFHAIVSRLRQCRSFPCSAPTPVVSTVEHQRPTQ